MRFVVRVMDKQSSDFRKLSGGYLQNCGDEQTEMH